MQVDENAIILSDIPEDTTVSILVPHSDTSTFQAMVCFRHSTIPFEVQLLGLESLDRSIIYNSA